MAHYLVHWDGYQANLQSACEKQFLSESFVDVTLAVDAGLIKCHRVILSAASSYFQQLLAQHNCAHPIIFMRDMQYWEVIALVDFMYRGEVSVEVDKLEQLMRAAQTLQVHGLSACLKACLERNNNTQLEDGEDSQASGESGGGEETLLEPEIELSTTISKLCELNSELELRPIAPSVPDTTRNKKRGMPPLRALKGDSIPTSQRNIVKEEIDFIGGRTETPTDTEPAIQIQSVFSEKSISEDKADNSDDCIEVEEEPGPFRIPKPDQSFRQFLLVSPVPGMPPRQQDYKLSLHDTPLYKKYSPRVLEQALRDLHTGRFRSIRACARHHGIPMTTLRYRAKVNPKRPSWFQNE